jgi:hypothetical protein
MVFWLCSLLFLWAPFAHILYQVSQRTIVAHSLIAQTKFWWSLFFYLRTQNLERSTFPSSKCWLLQQFPFSSKNHSVSRCVLNVIYVCKCFSASDHALAWKRRYIKSIHYYYYYYYYKGNCNKEGPTEKWFNQEGWSPNGGWLPEEGRSSEEGFTTRQGVKENEIVK